MTAGKLMFFLRKPLAGVGLGLLLTLSACESNVYKPPPPPKVTVARPERRPVTGYLEFTGNTRAINTVTLRARVQGYLDKVFFQDGDRVKKGQLLFLIQRNTYEDQLNQAAAQILQYEANYRYALIQVARYIKLVQQKAGAQSDLDNWRFQRDSSRAQILAAKANRDLAALNLGYTRVTAPFDGRIDRRLVDPGNLVGAGEYTSLVQISQIDPIYVYFTINEDDLLRVMGKTGNLPGQAEKEKIPYISVSPTKPGIRTRVSSILPPSASPPPPAPCSYAAFFPMRIIRFCRVCLPALRPRCWARHRNPGWCPRWPSPMTSWALTSWWWAPKMWWNAVRLRRAPGWGTYGR